MIVIIEYKLIILFFVVAMMPNFCIYLHIYVQVLYLL